MDNDKHYEAAGRQEIILKMAGAGISLTLYGLRLGNHKWKFRLDKDEGTMADFLLEEDADILPMLRTESEYLDTWDKALALLDRYQWTRFAPKEVHPEFRDLVRSAVQSRKPTRPIELKRPLFKAWEYFLRCDQAAKDEKESKRSDLNWQPPQS
jgi:hypothetical protein